MTHPSHVISLTVVGLANAWVTPFHT